MLFTRTFCIRKTLPIVRTCYYMMTFKIPYISSRMSYSDRVYALITFLIKQDHTIINGYITVKRQNGEVFCFYAVTAH